MKSRKLPTILIAIAFLFVVVFSCVFIFSVQEVRADFSATADFDSDSVRSTLDSFKGKNLLIFNLEDIKNEVEKNPKCEVLSVCKDYPNVINISIKERVPKFKITVSDKTYSLSGDGYVLEEIDENFDRADKLLTVSLDGITVTGVSFGKKIETQNDELFYSVLSTAKEVAYTDNATEIALNVISYSFNEAVISMRSGVKIRLWVDLDERFDTDLIIKAFDAYNGNILDANGNKMSDYEKFTSSIKVVRSDDGEIIVTWSED